MKSLCFPDMVMMIKSTVSSAEFLISMRTKPTAFTRKRVLPICDILYFILGSKKKALQTELDEFSESQGGISVTRQALSKARENIHAIVFEYLNTKLIKKYETEDANIRTYKGYRLLSADG